MVKDFIKERILLHHFSNALFYIIDLDAVCLKQDTNLYRIKVLDLTQRLQELPEEDLMQARYILKLWFSFINVKYQVNDMFIDIFCNEKQLRLIIKKCVIFNRIATILKLNAWIHNIPIQVSEDTLTYRINPHIPNASLYITRLFPDMIIEENNTKAIIKKRKFNSIIKNFKKSMALAELCGYKIA